MSELENAPTVDREEEQRKEAQTWIDQRGGLVYVVNLFKDLATGAVNTRDFVLRTQRDLVDCQQELANCENEKDLFKSTLLLNNITLPVQGGRKRRKARRKACRKSRRRKSRRKRRRTHRKR